MAGWVYAALNPITVYRTVLRHTTSSWSGTISGRPLLFRKYAELFNGFPSCILHRMCAVYWKCEVFGWWSFRVCLLARVVTLFPYDLHLASFVLLEEYSGKLTHRQVVSQNLMRFIAVRRQRWTGEEKSPQKSSWFLWGRVSDSSMKSFSISQQANELCCKKDFFFIEEKMLLYNIFFSFCKRCYSSMAKVLPCSDDNGVDFFFFLMPNYYYVQSQLCRNSQSGSTHPAQEQCPVGGFFLFYCYY